MSNNYSASKRDHKSEERSSGTIEDIFIFILCSEILDIFVFPTNGIMEIAIFYLILRNYFSNYKSECSPK